MSALRKAILSSLGLKQTSQSTSPPNVAESSTANDKGENSSSSFKGDSDIAKPLPDISTLNLEDRNLRGSNLKILTHTGNLKLRAYSLSGSIDDLRKAVSALNSAVALSDDDDPGKLDRLSNYSIALGQLFDRTQDISHLNSAISTIQRALDLTAAENPRKPGYFNFLSTALHKRSSLTGHRDSTDLDDAITNARKAIATVPVAQNKRLPIYLDHLGKILVDRFSRSRKTEDITEAIKNLIRAADLSADSSILSRYQRAGIYRNLGSGYLARFQQSDQHEDLNLAIEHHRHALAICSNGLGHRITREQVERQSQTQFALASSLLKNFTRFGNNESLNEAISVLRTLVDQSQIVVAQANSLKPNPTWLAVLGTLLSTRYNTSGNLHDLEMAIQYQRQLLDADLGDNQIPDSRLTNSGFIIDLATSLRRHFIITRKIDELEDAVSYEKKAILNIPDNHPHSITFRGELASSLLHRYSILGELSDLQGALGYATEALTTISAEDLKRSSHLEVIGNALVKRCGHLGDVTDVDRAIQYLMQGVTLLPSNHPTIRGYFQHLGVAFNTRSKISKSREDTDNAVFYFREALKLSMKSRLSKIPVLTALGLALATRYELFHSEEDISESISLFKEAIDLSYDYLWLKVDILRNLGGALRLRYETTHQDGDIVDSVSVLSESATLEVNNPKSGFLSAISWSKSVRLQSEGELGLASSLDVYKIAMDLLPHLSYIGASIQSRYHKLLPSSNFVCNAIAAALSADSLETAMEWVEQGCSIVWRQASQLRSSEYDSLRTTHPEHADRIQELTDKLGKGLQISSEIPHLDCGPQEYSKLAVEYDEYLAEVRTLNGYERFLLPKRFSELRGAAARGPVIVLNASEYGCDALILASPSSALHRVPLSDISFERALELRKTLELEDAPSESELVAREEDDWKHVRIHDPSPVLDANVSFRLVLRELWSSAVKPCVEYLQSVDIPSTKKPMHFHWCPLGPFASLPIHAAGIYEPDGTSLEALSDYGLSSYTTTISSLLKSNSFLNDRDRQRPSLNHKLLVIGSDVSSISSSISHTQQEIECIQTQAKVSGLTDTVVILGELDDPTPSQVTCQMAKYSSVHFAGNMSRNSTDTSQSCFVLPNSTLPIRDLVYADAAPRKLAFLTPGGSANGDEKLPEESIHFAAGMLHIGYEHVIATMWDVPFEDKLFVVDEVYKRLFVGGRFDLEDHDVGEVLDEVLRELRGRSSGKQFGSWISFMHFRR